MCQTQYQEIRMNELINDILLPVHVPGTTLLTVCRLKLSDVNGFVKVTKIRVTSGLRNKLHHKSTFIIK